MMIRRQQAAWAFSGAVFAALAFVVSGFAFSPNGVLAPQAVEVLHACYLPDVGAVYRIQGAGLPDDCVEETHVPFSWNAEGPAGPQGDAGPQGPPGISGVQRIFVQQQLPPNGVDIAVIAYCPAGTRVLGGGFGKGSREIEIKTSTGQLSPDRWVVIGWNAGDDSRTLEASAICGQVGS